jgi:hypothetical protein
MPSLIETEDQRRVRVERMTATLLKDADFCEALNALSQEVIESVVETLSEQSLVLLFAGFDPKDANTIIALVAGWIVGFDATRYRSDQERQTAMRDRLHIVTTAAGRSARIPDTWASRGVN